MPVFFVHDPAQGIVTPLDRKYRVRDIPPTSELTEINRIHPKIESSLPDQQRSPAQAYEDNADKFQGLGRVVDFMSHPVLSIEQSKSLNQAWLEMSKYEIHHLVIVDADNALVGMLTESAILNVKMKSDAVSDEQVPLSIFSQSEVLSTSPDTPIADLAVGLLELGLSGVPVTDNGVVVGMITRSDVLKVFLTQQSLNTNA